MEEALLNLTRGDEGVRAFNGDRVFWSERDRGSQAPALVFHTVWIDDDYTTKRRTAFARGLFQIDCLGATALQAIDNRNAVRSLLSGYRGGPFQSVFVAVLGEDFETRDGITTHRSILQARLSFHA